jgi:hypothetical protein
VNKETVLALVCVLALCERRCLFCQAVRAMAAILHHLRRCPLAALGSAWSEESRESIEILWSFNRPSLRASMVHDVQVMLLVDCSAVKARARCFSSSYKTLQTFAPALQVSYGRAESRLCMGATG